MLKPRILTALLLIPLVIIIDFAADPLWFALLFGLVIVLAAREWGRFAGFVSPVANGLFVFTTILLLVAGYRYRFAASIMQFLVVLAAVWWFIATLIVIAIQKQWFDPGNSRIFAVVTGPLVLVPAWLSLILLHNEGSDIGRKLVMLLFSMIWIADIVAYFAGRRWGRIALADRISPKKTREGAFAGIIASLIIAGGFAWLMEMQHNDIIVFLVLCLMTILISIIGDLFESLMKRRAQLKDSGSLLPGHGGVLDRIDSLTAAGPVFVAGLWWTGLFQ